MKYTVYHFVLSRREEFITDILSAQLGEIGFESFVTSKNGLDAYIQTELMNDKAVNQLIADFPFDTDLHYTHEFVEDKNWNEEWEKHYFKPIVIDNRCVIHSSFHKDVPALSYNIVIDPKMAFGTGHHETTSLMVSEILEMELQGKSVLDMGCGTSVLAILASIRGAEQLTAIDIDDWCVENSLENMKLNGVTNIQVLHGDASLLPGRSFDIILANINRNILLNDIKQYADCLPIDGELYMSGFYTEDIPVLEAAAQRNGLKLIHSNQKNNWALVKMVKVG